FGLHPALLDAAMHALGVNGITGDEQTELPFIWSGVSLHAAGATAVRVRLTKPAPDTLTMDLADLAGNPVASVGSVIFRPVSAEQLSGGGGESLYEVAWMPVQAVSAPWVAWDALPAGPVSGSVVYQCSSPDGDVLAGVRAVAGEVLSV